MIAVERIERRILNVEAAAGTRVDVEPAHEVAPADGKPQAVPVFEIHTLKEGEALQRDEAILGLIRLFLGRMLDFFAVDVNVAVDDAPFPTKVGQAVLRFEEFEELPR